jgi:asparagine synthase (glutamine-hydrolysing)
MCGIAGLLDRSGRLRDGVKSTATDMSWALHHRGPDDGGVWTDDARGVALASRRLAVIDLSPLGHQPMVGGDGRLVLTYNGEIYNFMKIRKTLEDLGCRFRGHSDTEVLLEAIAQWGLREALCRSEGMFAMALWDGTSGTLSLARDRLGEKPLYYGWLGDTFVFGSELKALKAHPDWKPNVDRAALRDYFEYGYIPAPRSIYAGIRKLPPGTIISVDARSGRTGDPEPYWSLEEAAAPTNRVGRSASEAVDALEELLLEAVSSRVVADVPVGAFLSGGIDSSLIVALMQHSSSRSVRTFTIGFDDPSYDESASASAIARHLGTDHCELQLTAEDALGVVPDLAGIYDEPFADWSQIPTLLVSQFARESVTVALSGDGGDELFGGYNRYSLGLATWDHIASLPLALRRVLGQAIGALPTGSLDHPLEVAARALPQRFQLRNPGIKLRKLGEILPAASSDDIFRRLSSLWQDPASILARGSFEVVPSASSVAPAMLVDPLERMMYADTMRYLPDDILVKVDRASMAVSLEARVPLLDYRVVEFAWTLPPEQRLRAGVGKWILREVLRRYVPPTLFERPKMGFGLPIGDWLRGPLHDWAAALIDPRRVVSEGYLAPQVVEQLWKVHQSGHRNQEHLLWSVLSFQAWLDHDRIATLPETVS